MPLSFAWEQIQRWVPKQQLPVQLGAKRGTVWDGATLVKHRYFNGQVTWQLYPFKSLFGANFLDLSVRAENGDLQATASLEGLDVALIGDLQVDLKMLQPILRKHRIDLGGLLTVRNLSAVIDSRSGLPLTMAGSARWEGGPVSYPLGRKRQTSQMPPLAGLIVQRNDEIVLDVNDEETGKTVMQMQFTQDGVVKIQIRKRLLDLADAPWGGGGSADDIVFKVQQKLI